MDAGRGDVPLKDLKLDGSRNRAAVRWLRPQTPPAADRDLAPVIFHD